MKDKTSINTIVVFLECLSARIPAIWKRIILGNIDSNIVIEKFKLDPVNFNT